MPITFLQAVNATLKRTRTIQGDAGELATSTVTSTATGLVATDAFTDSGRQVQIDLAIQLWQEASHEVFGLGLLPNIAATATIVLADGTREYSMPADFERFAGESYHQRVLRGATTGLLIYEYPGGYAQMLRDQAIATDYVGTPNYYAISPADGTMIRMDREGNSEVDGWTYNTLYDKRIALTSTMATSTFPFSDTVADALVPVVAEAHNRIMRKEFDSGLFIASLSRAVSYARRTQPNSRYGRRRAGFIEYV